MPFVKGQSGNPLGRKKSGGITLTDALRAKLDEKVLVEDADGSPVYRTWREVLTLKLLEVAREGNMQAMVMLFDRIDGKLAPQVEDATSDAAQVFSAAMRTLLDQRARDREAARV